MNYRLKSQNGRINYIMLQESGPVGSETRLDSAEQMLANGKPHKSRKFDGFPIAVKVGDCAEYFFPGEWEEPPKKPSCTADSCEIVYPERRRVKRIKDEVCQ